MQIHTTSSLSSPVGLVRSGIILMLLLLLGGPAAWAKGATPSAAAPRRVQAVPTITNFSPASGTVGSTITVTGTNLLGATVASLNGVAGVIVGTPTATSLTFIFGANAASGLVSVTTADGTATSTGTYTVVAVTTTCTGAPPLATSYVSNNSNKGEMFDIVATNTVTITCFDLNLILGSNGSYEIYYKVGSYMGSENNPAAWTLLGNNPAVPCVGFDYPSPLNIPLAVTIPAGQTVSFYITATNVAASTGIRYTNNGGYTTIASNADLAIASGIGKAYPFATNYLNRSFNGTVHYSMGPPATISSFTPTSGGAGTSVTVTGTNLSTATAARVNGTAGTITGTPTATSVTFTVGAGSTTGPVSILISGGMATSSGSFTVPTPPVLTTSGGSTAWTQGGGAVAVDAALTLTDADSPILTGATVRLTTNFQSSQDGLGFVNANGITGSYVAGTGVLTLSGIASVATYQAVLRSITYTNSAGTPNTATRTVSFVATDGAFASPAATKTITLTASPAPTISGLSLAAELPGMPVVITGTGFTAASTVSFGGVAASAVSYTSATSLTATVPAGAATGSSTVVVTTGGQSSSSAPAFTVLGVYAGTTSCLATTAYAASGDGAWHYLLTPAGAVVAALQDTRAALGNVSVSFQATGSASAVRQDSRSRKYLDRNFRLTASGGNTFTGQTVNLRFYGLTSEFTRLQAADASVSYTTLKATQYSGPNEDCELGNNSATGEHRTLTLTASTPGNGVAWFVAQAAVADHFSEFYLTGSAAPLPVELVAFTADMKGRDLALAWRTASEKNSARFEVERSTDGREFVRIGEVAAQGTTTRPTDYAFLDPLTPIPAYPHTLLYYRLRQVDLDGTANYSPVRSVLVGGKELLTLYPNPARSAVAVGGVSAGAMVEVFDALGRVVAQATADASGTAQLALPSGLAAGVYVVRSGANALRLAVE
jgi:hypothetical protein